MLAGFGLSQEKISAAQEVTKFIKAEITSDYNENTITLKLITEDPDAANQIPVFIKQYSQMFAQQLGTLFAMDGKLINIGDVPK